MTNSTNSGDKPKTASEDMNPALTWLYRNKFVETTPISGFTLIGYAKFKWEIAAILIVLTVFSGLTAKNVIEVVQEFIAKPTVTNVRIMDMSSSHHYIDDFYIELRRPTVFYMMAIIKDLDDQASPPWSEAEREDYITGIYNRWTLEMWDEVLDKMNETMQQRTRSDRDLSRYSWTYGFLFLVLMGDPALREGIEHDIKTSNGKSPSPRLLELVDETKTRLAAIDGLTSKRFNEIFRARYLDFYSLRIGEDLFTIRQAFLTAKDDIHKPSTNESQFKYTARFVRVSGSWYDFTFTLHVHLKRKYRNIFVYTTILSYIYDHLVEQELDKLYYDDTMMTLKSMDLTTSAVMYGDQMNDVELRLNSKFFTHADCSEYIDYSQCKANCEMQVVRQKCNCTRIQDDYLEPDTEPKDKDFCPPYYETSQGSCLEDTEVEDCDKECLNNHPCNYTFYQYHQLDRSGGKVYMAAFVRMLNNGTYYLFEEDYKINFYSFLAELGGSFDLWLGASIIGIVHAIVYLIKQIIYSCNKETKTGKNLRNMLSKMHPSSMLAPAALGVNLAIHSFKKKDFNSKLAELTARPECQDGSIKEILELFELLKDEFEPKSQVSNIEIE